MIDKRFTLQPDRKGALTSGIFYGSALLLSGFLSYWNYFHHQGGTFWFYMFFFSFWFALFSGTTSVLNQCLLLTPRSLKSITVTHNSIIFEKQNGDADELAKKLKFHGSRTIVAIWGQSLDKRKLQAIVRRRSLTPDQLRILLQELERLRELETRIS